MDLVFQLRNQDDIHPSSTVIAIGEGKNFSMSCSCLASKHGAPICTHIVAVLREDHDVVMYGRTQFDELKVRSEGSYTVDPNNGYWQFYSE
jgi:hypothetical protein